MVSQYGRQAQLTGPSCAQSRSVWRYVPVPRVGHVPMLEDPGFVLDVLDDWLPALPSQQEASRDLTT